jgi:hypothetical protein
LHDAECRFEPFGNKQPLAGAHLGQSHGAAGNWTKAGFIGFDSSLARAIRGNEGSMDGCRPVIYMFDQADHRRQICPARVRASGVEPQILKRWERKPAVGQIGLDDRPGSRSGLAPDGKRPRGTGCFVGTIVATHCRQLVILGWAAKQARAAQLCEHVAWLATPVAENENATGVAITDQ